MIIAVTEDVHHGDGRQLSKRVFKTIRGFGLVLDDLGNKSEKQDFAMD